MRIVHTPSPLLHRKSKPVAKITAEIKALVQSMIATLQSHKDPEGVGLAAIQVGILKQIFVMQPDQKSKITVCINPKIISIKQLKIIKKSKKNKKLALEGCLSIPKIWGHVDRATQVKLNYLDIDGKTQIKTFEGLEAIIVQHEMDHLEGVLFTKRTIEQSHTLYHEKKGELFEMTL